MDINQLISLLPGILPTVAAIGAMMAAGGSWQVARSANKNLRAQIVINLTDAYSKPEFMNAMEKLRDFEQKYKPEFPAKLIEELDKKSDEGKDINESRRMVKYHYLKIFRTRKLKLIDDDFVKEHASLESVQFILEVVKPLEKVLAENFSQKYKVAIKYDVEMFDMYLKLYPELSKAAHVA